MRQKAARGQLRGGDYAQTVRMFPRNMALRTAMHAAAVKGQPFAYTATPLPQSSTTPMPVPLWQQMNDKFTTGTLSMSDALAARRAGDEALATAINRAIAGLGWSYTPPTPTTPTTPTAPTPPAGNPNGPQVIVYPEDAWKNNPTLQWFNGIGQPNLMNQLSNKPSYDPATGVEIQAERNINAGTFAALDEDPLREGFMRSVYARANRDYDKERAAVMNAGPRGIATAYTRTG